MADQAPVSDEEALARAEQSEGYVAYFWYLLAGDLGEPEADARSSAMEDNNLVSEEDVQLVHFQLACWYETGVDLKRSDTKARKHLKFALGSGKLKLDRDLSRAITQVRERIGLPEALDLRCPLGPAVPNTPGNVSVSQLKRETATLLRDDRWTPRPSKPSKSTKPIKPNEKRCTA